MSTPKSHQLLNLTLAGLPELEHFEDDAARQKALTEIGEEAANLKSGGYWSGVGILAGATLVGQVITRWLLTHVVWPPLLEESLHWLVGIATFVLTLRWLHRSGVVAQLRTKLLVCGVPVCTKCGYLLRGLPLDPGRCPECGRPFDDPVRKILGGQRIL